MEIRMERPILGKTSRMLPKDTSREVRGPHQDYITAPPHQKEAEDTSKEVRGPHQDYISTPPLKKRPRT